MGEISEALRRAMDHAAPTPISKQSLPDHPDPDSDPDSDSGQEHAEDDSAMPIAASPAPTREASESEVQPLGQSDSQEVHHISLENGVSRAERISLLDPTAPAAVSVRQLAQQVKRQAGQRGMRSIVVTSPLSGDGKTTTSCNLAIALSSLDRSRSVVLVELDLRRPRVAGNLGLRVQHGIDDVLARKVSLEEALLPTDVPGLCVLAVRRGTSNPEHLLASANLTNLIRALERQFSMIVIDTPPILSVADALSVIDVADGCLLVVRAGYCPTASVRSAIEHLPAEKMLGCCLNFARRSQPSANYESYPAASIEGTQSEDSPEETE